MQKYCWTNEGLNEKVICMISLTNWLYRLIRIYVDLPWVKRLEFKTLTRHFCLAVIYDQWVNFVFFGEHKEWAYGKKDRFSMNNGGSIFSFTCYISFFLLIITCLIIIFLSLFFCCKWSLDNNFPEFFLYLYPYKKSASIRIPS